MFLHGLIGALEYLQITAARREVVGVREEQAFRMTFRRADTLQDFFIGQVGRVMGNIWIAIKRNAHLFECPALDQTHLIQTHFTRTDDFQQLKRRNRMLQCVVSRLDLS